MRIVFAVPVPSSPKDCLGAVIGAGLLAVVVYGFAWYITPTAGDGSREGSMLQSAEWQRQDKLGPAACPTWRSQGFMERKFGELSWCSDYLARKEESEKDRRIYACQVAIAKRPREEIAKIPGATHVQDGKTYINGDWSKEQCKDA